MPSPSTSQATLRPDIAQALMEFEADMDLQGYIALQVLPEFDAPEQHGVFPVIPIEQLLQNPETARNNKSGYNILDWTFTNSTYSCGEHGLKSPIDDRARKMYRNFFDAEVVTVEILRAAIQRAAERRVAEAVFNATTFTAATTTITYEWDSNHTATATPITDVETAVQAVYARTGVWPNALIINRSVFRNLRNLDQIIDRIQSGGAGAATKATDITAAMLAQVFDLEKVIVAGGSRSTAAEGQTAAVSQIWSSEYAMVAKVARTANFSEPCLGRTLHWSEDGSTIGGTIEQYRDENMRADMYRDRHDTDEKILYTEVGQLLDNVTT